LAVPLGLCATHEGLNLSKSETSVDEQNDHSANKKRHKKGNRMTVLGSEQMSIKPTDAIGGNNPDITFDNIPNPGSLHLSDTQMQKYAQSESDFVARTSPIEARLRILQAKFQQQLNIPELDINEISSTGSEITMQQNILNGLMIEHRVDMAKLLTGSQRLQVACNLQIVASHK